jgi:hypothetical protein
MNITSESQRPSDDLQVLGKQLRRELDRLDRDPDSADPELCHAYLHHAQALAWYRVAEGQMSAPRDVLDSLGASRSFVARHLPALPEPRGATAVEVHCTLSSLRLAQEALTRRRTEDRLAESRSATERAILQVLAANRGAFLRRGQVHQLLQLPDPLSAARVGQILGSLDDEGLLQRIHARAQGNPDSAFYALSALGISVCRALGILPEAEAESAAASPPASAHISPSIADARIIDQAIRTVIDPASGEDRRRIATGVLTSSVMGPERPVVWQRLCAAVALALERERGSREQLLKVPHEVDLEKWGDSDETLLQGQLKNWRESEEKLLQVQRDLEKEGRIPAVPLPGPGTYILVTTPIEAQGIGAWAQV